MARGAISNLRWHRATVLKLAALRVPVPPWETVAYMTVFPVFHNLRCLSAIMDVDPVELSAILQVLLHGFPVASPRTSAASSERFMRSCSQLTLFFGKVFRSRTNGKRRARGLERSDVGYPSEKKLRRIVPPHPAPILSPFEPCVCGGLSWISVSTGISSTTCVVVASRQPGCTAQIVR